MKALLTTAPHPFFWFWFFISLFCLTILFCLRQLWISHLYRRWLQTHRKKRKYYLWEIPMMLWGRIRADFMIREDESGFYFIYL